MVWLILYAAFELFFVLLSFPLMFLTMRIMKNSLKHPENLKQPIGQIEESLEKMKTGVRHMMIPSFLIFVYDILIFIDTSVQSYPLSLIVIGISVSSMIYGQIIRVKMKTQRQKKGGILSKVAGGLTYISTFCMWVAIYVLGTHGSNVWMYSFVGCVVLVSNFVFLMVDAKQIKKKTSINQKANRISID